MVRDNASEGVIYFAEETLTQQASAEECDINVIVARAKRGADVSALISGRQPMFADFTKMPSYRDALLAVTKARELFMTLDPFVRERFMNDPQMLLDFLKNPANREEAVKLGLVKPPEPVAPPIEAAVSGAKKAKPKAEDE